MDMGAYNSVLLLIQSNYTLQILENKFVHYLVAYIGLASVHTILESAFICLLCLTLTWECTSTNTAAERSLQQKT